MAGHWELNDILNVVIRSNRILGSPIIDVINAFLEGYACNLGIYLSTLGNYMYSVYMTYYKADRVRNQYSWKLCTINSTSKNNKYMYMFFDKNILPLFIGLPRIE